MDGLMKAADVDPVSVLGQFQIGRHYYLMGQYDLAVTQLNSFCRETLSQIPAPEGRQKIAPGERSQPGVRIFDKKSPGRGERDYSAMISVALSGLYYRRFFPGARFALS